MKVELRDYQDDAVRKVLKAIDSARYLHDAMEQPQSLSLSAPTGAGKTVMAAAVLEALLVGAESLDRAPMPDVTVLWVTASPSLNRQTIERIGGASSIADAHLVEIDESFDQPLLEPGRIYFLNTQKLGRATGYVAASDRRDYSVEDTIFRTARAKDRMLLLVLDEAHQGMGEQQGRTTIVQRLVDGGRGPSSVPIVWGISATLQRFLSSIERSGRSTVANVEVDVELVRASGLVKDRVDVAARDEDGAFEATYLRSTIDALREVDAEWRVYTDENDLPHVHPLAVVQVQDEVTDERLAEIVSQARDTWPQLGPDAFVHTFNQRATRLVAGIEVPYLAPERIQRSVHARVVFTMLALSTGWDCPRAEVMYSERVAKDATFIAQTIGRLARSPLAHRIESRPSLNRVRANLPRYDAQTVHAVVAALTGPDGPPIETARVSAAFPPAFDGDVLDVLRATPSQSVPSRPEHAVVRARRLARALSDDGLERGAPSALRAAIESRLRGLQVEHASRIAEVRDDVVNADVVVHSLGAATEVSRERLPLSDADVAAAFQAERRRIRDGVISDFRSSIMQADDEADVYEVMADLIALVRLDEVPAAIERLCDEWVRERLDRYDSDIRLLSAERGRRFAQIRGSGSAPARIELTLPDAYVSTVVEADGTPVAEYEGHVFAIDGVFRTRLSSSWERHVVATELAREHTVAWYRNPPTGAASVAIPRLVDGVWKALHPDFVFLARDGDGALRRVIVDPHDPARADALWKLQALASYAEAFAGEVVRVESVVQIDDRWVKLDHTKAEVRALVDAWEGDAVGLFESDVAQQYR